MAGLLLPAGLHAKALADLCLEHKEEASEMMEDHSCCLPEKQKTDAASHECDSEWECTCHFDPVPQSDTVLEAVTPTLVSVAATTYSIQTPVAKQAAEQRITDSPIRAGPPLFLLNSTFLN